MSDDVTWRMGVTLIDAIHTLCWFLRWVLDEDERRALRTDNERLWSRIGDLT